MNKFAILLGLLLLIQGFVWADAPATQNAAKPAVTEGLQLTITTAKASFIKGDGIQLLIVFKNAQIEPILLYDPRQESQWVVSCRSADGRSYMAVTGTEAGMTPGEILLKPGAKEDVLQRVVGRWKEPFGNEGEILTALPAGKYTLQATFVPLPPRSTGATAYWTAHVTSGPVAFEITDAPATQPATQPSTQAANEGSVRIRMTNESVEITVTGQTFPVRNARPVLSIGKERTYISRYLPSGEPSTLIFTMPAVDFAKTKDGDVISVGYEPGGLVGAYVLDKSKVERIASASDKAPVATQTTYATNGQIDSIGATSLKLHVFRGHSGIISKIVVDDATVVIIDSKPGKVTDLKVGQWVKVTQDEKKALKIEPGVDVWASPAATQPALKESEAVQVNGLDFQLVAQVVWVTPAEKQETTVPLKLKVTNQTDKAVTLNFVDTLTVELKDADGKALRIEGGLRDHAFDRPLVTVDKGQSFTEDRTARLQPLVNKPGQFRLIGPDGVGSHWYFDGLKPGKYTLCIGYENKNATNWVGKATTEELAIEVTDKPALQAPRVPDMTIMHMPPPAPPPNVRIRISNQSYKISPVDITLRIDGKEAITQKFEVGQQHNYETFWFPLPEKEFVFTVESKAGKATHKEAVTITKTHRFIDIDFVTDPDPKFSFQVVDEDRKTD